MMDMEDVPPGVRLLDMSLVLKVKLDKRRQLQKRKARVCVRGNKQEYGVDYFDTFAPCTQLSSVRLVIILALNLGLDVYHMDVETAFLNSTLGEDLYVRLPRGLEYQGRTCAKLLKAVYGLKQAGKEWFDTSDAFIMSYDKRMRRSDVEPCLYYIQDSDITVIILAYVDDYICATNSRSWYDNFVTTFNSQYTCKDLGVLDLVMGIGVRWGPGVAYLSQSGYISQMIDTYGLKDAKPASLPMSPGCSLAPSDGKDATIPFRGLLGQLHWIARCTRPDIMAAVTAYSALSRFCASYGPEHFVALKQVVRYLKGTMNHELVLRTTSSVPRGLSLAGGALPLSIYTDADYAGCKTTRRSTSGIAVYLCGSLLIFSSIMQRCVSLSTTEAEIIAMSEGAREVKYIINVLTDLVDICTPVPMYCDNQGAIHLASDYVNNNRSKHIEVRNMYIRELVKSKMVEAMYVASADNTADSALSRFCASYGPEHFVALKQVVRYLKGTMNHELVLRTTSSVPRGLSLAGGALPLSIYTDADYAGCKTTRRSTSGIAVYLCGSLLIFSSIMQRCVSLSTTEAEIIAMSEGAREVKYIINVLTDLVDICTPDDDHGGLRAAQIGVAVKGGADLGVHTVQAALDRHPEWVCVKADARNAFNAVHREAMFEAIERDFPELWAWTDLCYGVDANLGFRLGGVDGSVMRFVKSKEGTQQGDPLGPLYLAAPLQVVLERVQEGHPSVVIFAYLDDAFFLGPPVEAALAYETYMEEAVAIGLDIQPVKSAAFSPEGDASCFEAGMPGARGELDFIDVLGVPVGKAEAVSVEMLKKVEELCGILPLLNKLGHAQAQGLLLRFCAHPRLGFWLRGVPPEMMREAAEEHDRRMQGALRDLLPGGGLAWHCEFATLPHGMGLTKAVRVSSAAWLGGFAQVWEDMRELFPTVTAGTEDLGAESDLPYVNSLQAAMQKVSEAMEVIGEARGANEHLPPQVPKADDVKKSSDYSRSPKRAQRVYAAVLHSADWLWLAGHVGASRLPWLFSVTFNSIGPAFLRDVPCCLALELSSAEYRVALRHILHAEQPLLGQVEECPDCGGERDPTGTQLLACRGGVGAGGGNWYSFIHHKLQRVLFEVAKSAYPLASALQDDFAGYLTYSRNHCPDVTVLDAEGPGQHVLFDVATARRMSDAHLGAAMMAPGAAAKKVEESKVATYGDVRKHHFIPFFGVEVYGGLGPAAYGFLRKTQRCFRERRYIKANAEKGEQVDGNGDEDEDEDEETARGGAVGWKEKWVGCFLSRLHEGLQG
ncbi:hypothetical protein CYMTET_40017 [Cymbomonas tetramitiformis]|uniref:Reverse transcriptase Ty1/copia-type domain-containing protein n=1 Tax=Cymbomonas tetramitiformis TaxID=36881 RepID=A0AAE0F3P1_9CHLO|nr:hypothetical protein CYMTET_40017 [Cymbomonas tetramitiformis]